MGYGMNTLWLGYDGLDLPFGEIAAVLLYHPALDGRIIHAYGSVPRGVMAVVVTAEGAYVPSRLPVELLRRRWAAWRVGGPGGRGQGTAL
jgi:hypothetical protein